MQTGTANGHGNGHSSSGYDAATPVISNRRPSTGQTPRFSSLDGPILRVEYYREPVVASAAVSADHAAMAGAACQAIYQVGRVLCKRAIAKIRVEISSSSSCSGSPERRSTSFRSLLGTTTKTSGSNSSDNRSGSGSSSSGVKNSTGGGGFSPSPPVRGIANYGQTCFANAILQALAASDHMYDYAQQMRPLSSTANELYLVLQQLRCCGTTSDKNNNAGVVVDPRPLLRQFYASTHEQNDAQEFLQRLIDSVVDQVDWTAHANVREQQQQEMAAARRQRSTVVPVSAATTTAGSIGPDDLLLLPSNSCISSNNNYDLDSSNNEDDDDEFDDDDDERSWSSISCCQVAVQLKKSHHNSNRANQQETDDIDTKLFENHQTGRVDKMNAEVLVQPEEPTTAISLLPAIAESSSVDVKLNGMHNVEPVSRTECFGNRKGAPPMSRKGRHVMFSETKEDNASPSDAADDEHDDELHVNFSKDTVISAESVWIHSYSYNSMTMGEEKKDDAAAAVQHLPTGLDVLKQSAFYIENPTKTKTTTTTRKKKAGARPHVVAEYSALSPSPLHGWMGTLLTCDACQSKDRPIANALCCTIPVLPTHPHLVDCVRAVLAAERVEHVQCQYCPRDPSLILERQDWINAIRHAASSGADTSALQAELDRVEEALKVAVYVDATKASLFMRLPAVLSLHIQRRQSDGRKNTQHVSFDETFFINGTRYRLIAVIEHLGGPNSGHYVCYRPQWWRISDRNVRPVDWHHVRSSQAYMLFYERVDTTTATATTTTTTAVGGGE